MEQDTKEPSQAGLEADLRAFVADRTYPCVGAKSAAATGGMRVVAARDIMSGTDDLGIYNELKKWVARYAANPDGFRSLAVVFQQPSQFDEVQFEQALWQRLQALADIDAAHGEKLDVSVSAQPQDADFALSLAGKAFFVVGLHPAASRPARRFGYPTMVFNLHDQFVRLREQQLYHGMREKIIRRDIALAGSINPMLANHGDRSAAVQYIGRNVDDAWVCPFRDRRA